MNTSGTIFDGTEVVETNKETLEINGYENNQVIASNNLTTDAQTYSNAREQVQKEGAVIDEKTHLGANSLKVQAREVLHEAKSVFPFDFFPTKIVVDRFKIELSYGMFFFSKQLHTFPMGGIHNVTVNTSPFFSSITFEVAGLEKNPAPIPYVVPKDATIIKQLIDSIKLASESGVDVAHLKKEEILDLSRKTSTLAS